MNAFRTLLLILFSVSSFFSLIEASRSYDYPIRNFARDDYFGGAQNWAIAQQKNGWIYVANNHGLLEFDGNRWRCLPIPYGPIIRSICMGDDHRIYVGSTREFGYFSFSDRGAATYHSLVEFGQFGTDQLGIIWRIHPFKKGYLFVSDTQDCYYYDGESVVTISAPDHILYSSEVNGAIFFSTENGVFVLSDRKFEPLVGASLLNNKRICGFFPFDHGLILIATESDGFYLYDGLAIRRWNSEIDAKLRDEYIFSVNVSADYVAIGTVKEGVILLDRKGKVVSKYSRRNGLQNNTVLSLFFDRDGSLWLGLDRGIDLISLKSPVLDLVNTSDFIGAGYCSLSSDHYQYFGTNQGLYYIHSSAEGLQQIRQIPQIHSQVWNIQLIRDQIYCSTNEGLFLIEGQQARRIGSLQGVWTVVSCGHDRLIAGTYHGLYLLVFQQGEWSVFGRIGSFKESARILVWDKAGDLWMSHGSIGLFRFRFNEQFTDFRSIEKFTTDQSLPSNIGNSVFQYSGSILAATNMGIFSFDIHSNKFSVFPDLVRLPMINNSFSYIHFLDENRCWYVVDNCLGYTDRKGSTIYGMLPNRLIGGFEQVVYHPQIQMYCVATENGFSFIDLRRMLDSSDEVQTVIKSIEATYPIDTILFFGGTKGDLLPVEVPYGRNSLRICWATASFDSYKNIEYSFVLEGSSQRQWSEWRNVSEKEYEQLPDGEYVFRVRTRSIYNDQIAEATIRIVVLPPWYRSKLALALYYNLLISLFFILFFAIRRRLERSKQRFRMQSQIEIDKREQKIEALKEQQLENELLMKNQELSNSLMLIIRKNEILLYIKEQLAEVRSLFNQKSFAEVNRQVLNLQSTIAENISTDNYWERFEQNFDLANSFFLKNLHERFPQLTIQDKKLCVFLKMNLSTKEIAPLLGISDRGVEIARYRLRKKLSLDRSDHLIQFLQSFEDAKKV